VKRIFEEYIGRTNQDLLVEKEKVGDVMVFRCRGALSAVNSDALNDLVKAIGTAGERRAILDLSEVVHLDSIGLGSIAAAYKQATTAGTTLVLVARPRVRDTLELASLNKFLRIFDSLKLALAAD